MAGAAQDHEKIRTRETCTAARTCTWQAYRTRQAPLGSIDALLVPESLLVRAGSQERRRSRRSRRACRPFARRRRGGSAGCRPCVRRFRAGCTASQVPPPLLHLRTGPGADPSLRSELRGGGGVRGREGRRGSGPRRAACHSLPRKLERDSTRPCEPRGSRTAWRPVAAQARGPEGARSWATKDRLGRSRRRFPGWCEGSRHLTGVAVALLRSLAACP